jgi:hypothetical protein
MASNESDYIQVSPKQLHEMAHNFSEAQKDIYTLRHDLQRTADQLIKDLYAELKHSPEALELVCKQWYKAEGSEENFLLKAAHGLNLTASIIQIIDQNAMPKGSK